MTRRRSSFLPLLGFVCMMLVSAQASASLIVAPVRVVFEKKAKTAALLLINSDNKPHTYRISWKMLTADDTGQYHDVPMDMSDKHIVPNMVIAGVKQVHIEANGRQNVRLALRLPPDLPAGEYRAHLQFDTLPDDEDQTAAAAARDRKGAGLSIRYMLGISIPVIVRTGGAAAPVKIVSAKLANFSDNNKPSLEVTLAHPVGSYSSYGSMSVFQDGAQIGTVNNVAIYPEQAKRSLAIVLNKAPKPGSTIKVTYDGAGEYGGQKLAEENVTITQ
jgi:P pilus assembly chaperone PapD